MTSLNESPYMELRNYIPASWNGNYGSENQVCTFEVSSHMKEYQDIMSGFEYVGRLYRHQNINQYGMFLIRQQQLQELYSNVDFVIVTRYCRIRSDCLNDALKFNLDHRRLPVNLTMNPQLNNSGHCVLIVKCIIRETELGESDLTRSRDCDWYIEYVVD